MKNPAFWIVCFLVAAALLMRGSVHAWAITLIQILVAAGLMSLVAEQLREMWREQWRVHARAKELAKVRTDNRISSRGLPAGRVFWRWPFPFRWPCF